MTAPQADGFVVGPHYAAAAAALGGFTVPMSATLAAAVGAVGVRLDRDDPTRLVTSSGQPMDVSTAYRLVSEAGVLDQIGAARVDSGIWVEALGVLLAQRQREQADAAEPIEPTGAVSVERHHCDSHAWPPDAGGSGFVARAKDRWSRDT